MGIEKKERIETVLKICPQKPEPMVLTKKVRTAQHWSGLGSTVRDPLSKACWMPYPWSDKGRQ
jgi:hypothetical protein